MNNLEKEAVERLMSMSVAEARRNIASGLFGQVGSQNYDFARAWLWVREGEERDEREADALANTRSASETAKEALRIARAQKTTEITAAIAAVVAAIAAIISIIVTVYKS